jgi:hypothetical protein
MNSMNSMNSNSDPNSSIFYLRNRIKYKNLNSINLAENNNINNHRFYDTDFYVRKNDEYDDYDYDNDDEDKSNDIRKTPIFWIYSLLIFCIFYYIQSIINFI